MYFVRKYAHGRRHFLAIGEHGREGLTEPKARAAALEIIASLRRGRDPAAERLKLRTMPTLAEFAADVIDQRAAVLKPGTIANYRSLLAKHIAPRDARGCLRPGCLGGMRINAITRQQVTALHRAMHATPRAANHVLDLLSVVYKEANAAGLVAEGENPARKIRRYHVQPRQRFLDEDELTRLGAALAEAETEGAEDVYAIAALRLLVLTGSRRDEILTARWDWVDFTRGMLDLPDSKTGRKTVFLNAAALDVLRGIPRVAGNPHIIAGRRAGQRLVGLRRVWVRIRERAALTPTITASGKIQEVRLHDLRHSFASLAVAGGASLPMIGKLLGHRQVATTARYAHLADNPLRRVNEEIGARAAAAMLL
jgi:integrase